MRPAYYNEIDLNAAEWLRALIRAGVIADGDVDTRSIEDVAPDDLRAYGQCHFFAGIGVWSYALRSVGIPDDANVWTGSCPCQPFSAAGKGAGFADERHLWPHFQWLIAERKPAAVVGEQVASKDVDPWIDLVQDDLEAVGYAVGAVPFPSAGVGAPNIRDRCYWGALWLGDPGGARLEGLAGNGGHFHEPGRLCQVAPGPAAAAGGLGGLADAPVLGRLEGRAGIAAQERDGLAGDGGAAAGGPGACNGFWADPDWLFCRDGKWRAVEPGTSPLAHGAPGRVGRLRAYGNAINAQAAIEFCRAFPFGGLQ